MWQRIEAEAYLMRLKDGRRRSPAHEARWLNLLGFALAQLFYGPLSDRIGRRPVLLGGMVGFALLTLACALAPTIGALIVARALQGVLACAETVMGLIIIRELYDKDGSVRVLGAYGMAVALAPAVGPLIGGWIHVWFGWRANFLLLTPLIVIVVLLIAIAESTLLIQLTPGGLGLREGAILGGAALLGIPVTLATSVALLDRLLVMALTALLTPPAMGVLKARRDADA